jgi:hypothetical protein
LNGPLGKPAGRFRAIYFPACAHAREGIAAAPEDR